MWDASVHAGGLLPAVPGPACSRINNLVCVSVLGAAVGDAESPCAGLRVSHAAEMLLEVQQWVQKTLPYWDRKGGRDHIWLLSHVRPALLSGFGLWRFSKVASARSLSAERQLYGYQSASQASSKAARVTSRSLPPRMISPACRGAGTELLCCKLHL